MKLTKFQEKLIERYMLKPEYYVRIRNNLIEVYYNGVLSFKVTKSKFELNSAFFKINTKNRKGLNNIPKKLEKDVEKLEQELDFYFTLGSLVKGEKIADYKYRLKVEASKNNKKYLNNKDVLDIKMENLKDTISKYTTLTDEVYLTPYCKGDKNKKYGYYFYIKNNVISYKDLFNLSLESIEQTYNKTGIKSITLKVELKSKRKDKNVLKEYTTSELNSIDEIMERRIEIYIGKTKENNRSIDLGEVEPKYEKVYQQRLWEYMSKKDTREKLGELFPFLKGSIPFELEYNLLEDNSKDKHQESKKGRVDNAFIRDNTLVLVEIKYDENVILKSNGIHKHLVDLDNSLKKNKDALKEAENFAKDRFDTLNTLGVKLDYNVFIKEIKNVEYYVICGYSKTGKKKVEDTLISASKMTVTDAEANIKGYDQSYKDKTINSLVESLRNITVNDIKIFKEFDIYTSDEFYTISERFDYKKHM